jgi:hypothetical protein
MPGAPQLITQTIPLTEVLIGVISNVENPDGLTSVLFPPVTGPPYPTGFEVGFSPQFGRFSIAGAGSSTVWELLSITSVTWEFSRLADDDEAGAGVHVIGPTDAEIATNSSTLSWTTGSAVSHEYSWDQGGGGADRPTRTVGYATRAEVSDGDLTGDGPGLLDSDGTQSVGWSGSPPIAGGIAALKAFGQQFDSGDDQPFIGVDSVTIVFTRRRLGGGGPYLGMRR